MKCPHCGINFHENWIERPLHRDSRRVYREFHDHIEWWFYRTAHCPACDDFTIEVTVGHSPDTASGGWRMVYPIGANRGPVDQNVPKPIAEDYVEACNVLPISSKASAALSRRCLQHMLHENGYRARDLAHEIDALLAEVNPLKALPRRVRDALDDIRHFGNFAAHPTIDKGTLDVIDVEEHEAEACLETIEQLFEHFYIGPAEAKAKRDALNAKLTAAGKPLAKS